MDKPEIKKEVRDIAVPCPHRLHVCAGWHQNDITQGAPVLCVDSLCEGSIFLTLMNEIVKVQCPDCYFKVTQSAEARLMLGKPLM